MVNEEANEIKQQQAANPQEEIDATTAQVLELAENTEAETTDVHTVDYSTFQKMTLLSYCQNYLTMSKSNLR
jgi:hypothetical protein